MYYCVTLYCYITLSFIAGLVYASEIVRYAARPWQVDDLDVWVRRLQSEPPHKCAVIFVDNSGIDIILGVFPFARELLRRGTRVSGHMLFCLQTPTPYSCPQCLKY